MEEFVTVMNVDTTRIQHKLGFRPVYPSFQAAQDAELFSGSLLSVFQSWRS